MRRPGVAAVDARQASRVPGRRRSWRGFVFAWILLVDAGSALAQQSRGRSTGRNVPTTGEINCRNVFTHIKARGFTGVVGMEHGNSRPAKEGERAVIDAYRACDPVAGSV